MIKKMKERNKDTNLETIIEHKKLLTRERERGREERDLIR